MGEAVVCLPVFLNSCLALTESAIVGLPCVRWPDS